MRRALQNWIRRVVPISFRRFVQRALYRHRKLLPRKVASTIIRLVNPGGSLFIPPNVHAEEFFNRLEELHVRYVVLRWFEQLPWLDPEHDLDFLIADECLDAMRAEFTPWPGGHPVDIYTVSGIGGTGISRKKSASGPLPMFPARVAREMLENRVRFAGVCYVPSPRDHFCALAYHAAYVKPTGLALPHVHTGISDRPGAHDYAATLANLAAAAGIRLSEVSRQGLDEWLARHGWRPDARQRECLGAAAAWVERT